MFCTRMFPDRMFAPRFFPKVGADPPAFTGITRMVYGAWSYGAVRGPDQIRIPGYD